ncbi:MAG: hypothetical protein Q9184_007684 [Pyrenodesmia sp. 2 TL-2023]
MKRKRTQSPESTPSPRTPPLPLTYENLTRLPGSPPRTANSDSTMPKVNAFKAAFILEMHGLKIENGGLPSPVADKVAGILGFKSEEMTTDSAKKIINKLIKNRGKNELSVMHPFWNKLYKETYRKKGAVGEGNQAESEWADQGLDMVYDQVFEGPGVSELDIENPDDAKVIEAIPDMKKPKPDILFGIHGDNFTFKQKQANATEMHYAGISPGLWHPFCVDEDKGTNGSIEESELQSLRASSTLVAAIRTMMEHAGMLDPEKHGVDASNIIFSFCVTAPIAKLFVHYAVVGEDEPGRTVYHMKQISDYSPEREADLKRFRSNLEQILDWGTLARRTARGGIDEMLEKIMTRPKPSAAQGTPNKVAKSAQGSSAGEKSRGGPGTGASDQGTEGGSQQGAGST